MKEHFQRSAVVIADGIYHLTLQVTQQLPEAQAIRNAMAEGRHLHVRNRDSLEQFTADGRAEIIYLSSIRNHPRYDEYLGQMRRLFHDSIAFQETVSHFAGAYLRRVGTDENLHGEYPGDSVRQLATEYLLQECALLACLNDMGWKCVAYGGRLDTFEKLAEGEIGGAPTQLRMLPFASLRFDKRGGRSGSTPLAAVR
jgi:tRNA-dependent cyclodipeptide synthase